MKSPEKKWSFITAINLSLVLWFTLVTNHCSNEMRRAQQSIPPPPPDDYLGALVLFLSGTTAAIFGILFIISFSVLIFLFVKNKYFRQSEMQENKTESEI